MNNDNYNNDNITNEKSSQSFLKYGICLLGAYSTSNQEIVNFFQQNEPVNRIFRFRLI